MTKREHDRIQSALDNELTENLYTKYGYIGIRAEGFRQGILVAKSILHDEYESQRKKGSNND